MSHQKSFWKQLFDFWRSGWNPSVSNPWGMQKHKGEVQTKRHSSSTVVFNCWPHTGADQQVWKDWKPLLSSLTIVFSSQTTEITNQFMQFAGYLTQGQLSWKIMKYIMKYLITWAPSQRIQKSFLKKNLKYRGRRQYSQKSTCLVLRAGFNSGTPYGPPILPEVVSEHRARSTPGCALIQRSKILTAKMWMCEF